MSARISRSILTLALLATALLPTPPATPPATPADHLTDNGTTPGFRQEVRLRKMHLVRPDLIPYPTYHFTYA